MKTTVISLAAWIALVCSAAEAETRMIALTFDDAPRQSSVHFDGATRAAKLIAALDAAEVPQVAFFCNTERFDASGMARIEAYAEAGHLIANHSHTHLDLHRAGAERFLADVRAADAVLRNVTNRRKWFRYPYLHEGQTAEERDLVRHALKSMEYLSAYVTIDNYDWYMDALFQEAVRDGKTIDFDRLRETYVDLLAQSVEFYDGLSREQLGRSPRHVLLLHENDLAALYIGDLAARLRREGWEIISPELAYSDPIAATEPNTLALGQGRVVAIAAENGYQGPTRRWEDEEKLKAEFNRRGVWR
jgi:peptidoglycan/xylan/chitin deacetylase (PgdA/CDA1 family)